MNKPSTFAGIPVQFSSFAESKILLQSFPYDGTSTWGKGADKGFAAFLDAAENMELYDIETQTEVYRHGIHITEELSGFSSPEDMFKKTYARALSLIESGKFCTFFGGEHSISIGVIKAFYKKIKNLSVLQIDAHADLRKEYDGSPYNHACAMYDASINTNLVQVGIRSMDQSEVKHMDMSQTFFMEDMRTNNDWQERSLSLLTDDVYLSLDLDALDPSIMPATGTPEPGGMMWYELCNYLKSVFIRKNVVGFDIVELAPISGYHAPQFLAAKLYYKMLSYKFMSDAR